MDDSQKLLARRFFKLRVYESHAGEYQRLFEKVIGYQYPGFVPVRPHGKYGDGGNDGYEPSTGTYFQVHAPENPSDAMAISGAAKKAGEDFGRLLDHWHSNTPIRRYRFVFNDKFSGSPKPVEEALANIRKSHDLDALPFLAKDLEAVTMQLPDDQIFDVIGTIVTEPGVFPPVDFTVLGEVIRHILNAKLSIGADTLLAAPDFDQKIEFNGLTVGVANLLTVGSYQREVVVDFFAKNSEFAKQRLRDRVAAMYLESVREIGAMNASPKDRGDMIFFTLRKKMTSFAQKGESSAMIAAEEAATVVMAFYFEACDVFEEPPNASS